MSPASWPSMGWPRWWPRSPPTEARDWVRASVPNFVEVYVAAPVEVCAERDVKGLYARALSGELPHFTGVSDPYEPPESPELVLHTDKGRIDESVAVVLGWLERRGLTPPLQTSAAPGSDHASYW